jgi:F0F1-type ATP synthase epsilon subunit
MVDFVLQIVTRGCTYPERTVRSLNAPGVAGRLTVLARHEPLICSLAPGSLTIDAADGQREAWTIEAGTLRVGRDRVTLVTRSARGPHPAAGPSEYR